MVFLHAQVNEYSPAMQCGSALQRCTSGCGPTRSTPALSIAGNHATTSPWIWPNLLHLLWSAPSPVTRASPGGSEYPAVQWTLRVPMRWRPASHAALVNGAKRGVEPP